MAFCSRDFYPVDAARTFVLEGQVSSPHALPTGERADGVKGQACALLRDTQIITCFFPAAHSCSLHDRSSLWLKERRKLPAAFSVNPIRAGSSRVLGSRQVGSTPLTRNASIFPPSNGQQASAVNPYAGMALWLFLFFLKKPICSPFVYI